MEVVIIKAVDKLGQVGEIKRVSSGYARNFLLPRHLVVLATAKVIKAAEERKKALAKKAQEQLQQHEIDLKELAKLTLSLKRKATAEGKLFAAVEAKILAVELKARKINIEPKFIKLKEPLKKLGEYDIPVELTAKIKGKFKLIIEKEASI